MRRFLGIILLLCLILPLCLPIEAASVNNWSVALPDGTVLPSLPVQADLPEQPAAGESSEIEAELPIPTTSAKAAVLIDLDGRLIYAHRAEEKLPMASTTKIMTALIAIEEGDPEAIVTIPKEAVGVEGSSAYLMLGEQLALRDLLYALMLNSANDAATAIAIHIAGSVEAFAERMNRKATELGLLSTHFTNPHGLDNDAHYTTAYDLARLTAYALKNEQFAEIVSTVKYVCPLRGNEGSRVFVNHNRLLRSYEGAIGVKTGYTKRTGRCLVSAACRDGLTLICVTLNDPDDWKDHAALLDYGFSRYEPFSMPEAGAVSRTVPVVGGEISELTLVSQQEITALLPKGSTVTEVIECPRFVYGGIEEGQVLGKVVWFCDGRKVGEVPLYAQNAAPAVVYAPTLIERIGGIVHSIGRFFKNLIS